MYHYIWKITITDPTKVEPFIQVWKDASAVLQEYPGAQGTYLHKVLGEDNVYLAIANWESKAARDAMKADIDANTSERAQRWQAFPKSDEFGIFETIAKTEDLTFVEPS
jgi:heme-degrading monooxygenase HmoA